MDLREAGVFQHRQARLLALGLVGHLVEQPSLNEYMERALPLIGEVFGRTRAVLVDYREHADLFQVLHFTGYPADALYTLGRRLEEMDLRTALNHGEPYLAKAGSNVLVIPLYFSDILEALIVLEGDDAIELTPARKEAAALASRLLGVIMSSTRLAVNREQLVDMDDLRRARQIQLSFLPKQRPAGKSCEVFGRNKSSAHVGGDYFDFFRHGDGMLQCILADACGHGMAAALIMSNFRGLLQSEVLRRSDLRTLFDRLNRSVHFDEDFIQYLTGVFLDFHEESKRLRYLNAGHYEPIVLGEDGEFRTLPGGGPPLGMFRDSRYPLCETQLQPGDLVALFTDGLIDIENKQGEYFGVEGVLAALRAHRSRKLSEVASQTLKRAYDFSGPNDIEDDITLFLMRVL